MEYWRWWVVHLWVEGFFEVFATAAFAFVFYNMGFVRRSTATASTFTAAAIFMLGGVPGTLHHLYFSGSTSASMAIGVYFSALEVVPLVLLPRGIRALVLPTPVRLGETPALVADVLRGSRFLNMIGV